MAECGYCGTELPEHDPHTAGRHREYCCDSHRVLASRLRTAETLYNQKQRSDAERVGKPNPTGGP
jgi:hypothetical protein